MMSAEGPVETECFDVSPVCLQSIYIHRNGCASGRKMRNGESFFHYLLLYIHRKGRAANAWQKRMTVDTNGLRHLPIRLSKNCGLYTANSDRQTDRFKEKYNIDKYFRSDTYCEMPRNWQQSWHRSSRRVAPSRPWCASLASTAIRCPWLRSQGHTPGAPGRERSRIGVESLSTASGKRQD